MKFYIYTFIINSLPRWLEYYASTMSYIYSIVIIGTIVPQLFLIVPFTPLQRLNNDVLSQPPDNFD